MNIFIIFNELSLGAEEEEQMFWVKGEVTQETRRATRTWAKILRKISDINLIKGKVGVI